MANKSINMTQVRRIIQLRAEGLSKLKIAESLHIHRSTLDSYLSKLVASGKSFSELSEYSEEQLQTLVYSEGATPKADERIDDLKKHLDYFRHELTRTGVTRRLLWEEYHQAYPEGYRYTQFCEHFARHIKTTKATMHLTHLAGNSLQVDFAGKHLHYIDVQTGEIISCPVLICTLPFSGYTYVEALPSARQEHLFSALNRCLEYLGGIPKNILSDNMKQYVDKNHRYEYKFQELADQWAVHYKTNLLATRPRKPKDKPSVEGGVYLSYLDFFVWEGKTTSNINHPLIKKMLNPAANQNIFLFTRTNDRLPFTFEGNVAIKKYFDTIPIKIIWRIIDNPYKTYDELSVPENGDDKLFYEGISKKVYVSKFERNPLARRICIEHYGPSCFICGFNFYQTYGDLGKDFIHVHHLIPLSEIRKEYSLDPLKDLIPICPNCHAIVHRDEKAITPMELKQVLKNKS